MGIVIMFIGFTGSAFNLHETRNLGLDEVVRFGHYDLKLLSVEQAKTPNYQYQPRHHSKFARTARSSINSSRRFASINPASSKLPIVGIRRRLNEDLYINFSGIRPTTAKPSFSSMSSRWCPGSGSAIVLLLPAPSFV